MTAETLPTARTVRRWAFALSVAGVAALAGCKTDKEAKGSSVARGKQDPLVYGPLIPKQNVPVPDRATGVKGTDPLTTPTGGKAGYNDDPARFKGTYIEGKGSTPAALAAGRFKDGEELKIADTSGVPLTRAGGTLPDGTLEPPEDTLPLLAQLETFGVARDARSFERDDGKYVFRASVPIPNGARRQYVGVGMTARDAVKQVLDQIANDPK
jgi:hypothetical protein